MINVSTFILVLIEVDKTRRTFFLFLSAILDNFDSGFQTKNFYRRMENKYKFYNILKQRIMLKWENWQSGLYKVENITEKEK